MIRILKMKRRSFIASLLGLAAAILGMRKTVRAPYPNAVKAGGVWPPPGWQLLMEQDGKFHNTKV
jgi:hypothetical protein